MQNTSITKKSRDNPSESHHLPQDKQGIAVAWADIIYSNKFTLTGVQQMHYEQLYGAVGDSIHCNAGLWFKIDVPHETRRGPESESRLFSMFMNRGGFLLKSHFSV